MWAKSQCYLIPRSRRTSSSGALESPRLRSSTLSRSPTPGSSSTTNLRALTYRWDKQADRSQEARSKEWPLPEHLSRTPRFSFLTKPRRHSTKRTKLKSRVQLMPLGRNWEQLLQLLLPTDCLRLEMRITSSC
jgi:hypothetical protein